MVCRLRYTPPVAKGFSELINNADQCRDHLVNTSEENRTAFLSKRRCVFGRQPESAGCGIVFNISGGLKADTAFMETVKAEVEQYAPALKDSVAWSDVNAAPPF